MVASKNAFRRRKDRKMHLQREKKVPTLLHSKGTQERSLNLAYEVGLKRCKKNWLQFKLQDGMGLNVPLPDGKERLYKRFLETRDERGTLSKNKATTGAQGYRNKRKGGGSMNEIFAPFPNLKHSDSF
ncbi:hypothetical protein Tco_0403728 [Tanacetum coccineum]